MITSRDVRRRRPSLSVSILAVLGLLLACGPVAGGASAGPDAGSDGFAQLDGSVAPEDEVVVRGELGRELDTWLTRLTAFGYSGAMLVAKDDEIVLQNGYGRADREAGRPVTPATVFTIGSIAKQFTGAAVLVLENDGALDVDDPIAEHLEGVPADKQSITIHHLLTHTAGFPGAIGPDFGDDLPGREAFVDQALATELLFEPGARYEYSNVGYSLAAVVIEKVTGQDYETVLRDRLFGPAGMEHTGYTLPDYEPADMAVGYREGERWGTFLERYSAGGGPSWHLKGNGGIQSTVGDMYRWHLALEGDAILTAEQKARYQGRLVDEGFGDSWYGYGWVSMDAPGGGTLLTHNGGNPYFSADFRRYVDSGVVVFGTSSSAAYVADDVTRRLAAIALGLDNGETDPPPATVELTAEELRSFEGSYRLEGGDTLHVVTVGEEPGGIVPGLELRGEGPAAESLLAGGDAEGPAPGARRLAERTLEIVRRWIDGDARDIHEAMGGNRPLEQLEASLQEVRQMREEMLGPIGGVSIAGTAPRDAGLRVYVEFEHRQRPAHLAFDWEGGELAGIDMVREVPRPVAVVLPTSPVAFASFDLGSPSRLRVRFEDETLVVEAAGGEVRAVRR